MQSFQQQASNSSSYTAGSSSEVTQPVENIASEYHYDDEMSDYDYERQTTITTNYDYGGDDDDEEMLGEKISMGTMGVIKSSIVILVTSAAIAAYIASFVMSFTVSSASAAGTIAVGVAGGVCLLTTPLVWVSEWKLGRLPGKWFYFCLYLSSHYGWELLLLTHRGRRRNSL